MLSKMDIGNSILESNNLILRLILYSSLAEEWIK